MAGESAIIIVIVVIALIWFFMAREPFSTGEGALLQLATSRPGYNPGELEGAYPFSYYGPYYPYDVYNPYGLYYPYNRYF